MVFPLHMRKKTDFQIAVPKHVAEELVVNASQLDSVL